MQWYGAENVTDSRTLTSITLKEDFRISVFVTTWAQTKCDKEA